MKLSHLDEAGRARMVDVGDKPLMDRTAVAIGTIRMSPDAFRQVAEQAVAKGDVLAVSEVAGTLAAKRRYVVKRNISLLPVYSILLGLIALLGYMALTDKTTAANVKKSGNAQLAVP